jgi:uroporphyrinogen III methyltransferase/synthase
MGVGNLSQITEELMRYGKLKDTPVALVHRGTTGRQRSVTGKLENIVEVVRLHKITSPSIIIIGDVVNLRDPLNWYEKLPLQGKKIMVTRSRQQSSELSRKLKASGGEVIEFPTIQIEPPDNQTEIDSKIREVSRSKFIIFTSVNGVRYFFKRLAEIKLDIRDIGTGKIIAIGAATEEALKERGLMVDLIPEAFTSEGILDSLKGIIRKNDKVSLPRAEIGRKNLITGLEELGAVVDDIPMYKTIIPNHKRDELIEILQEGIDIITFTSSSTVLNLLEILGSESKALLKDSKIAVIGPVTGQTAKDAGLMIDIEAKEHSIQGLMDAIMEE